MTPGSLSRKVIARSDPINVCITFGDVLPQCASLSIYFHWKSLAVLRGVLVEAQEPSILWHFKAYQISCSVSFCECSCIITIVIRLFPTMCLSSTNKSHPPVFLGATYSSILSSAAGFHYGNSFYSHRTGMTVNHKGAFSTKGHWHDLAITALKLIAFLQTTLQRLLHFIQFLIQLSSWLHQSVFKPAPQEKCSFLLNSIDNMLCVYIAAMLGQRKDTLYLTEGNWEFWNRRIHSRAAWRTFCHLSQATILSGQQHMLSTGSILVKAQ